MADYKIEHKEGEKIIALLYTKHNWSVTRLAKRFGRTRQAIYDTLERQGIQQRDAKQV